MSQYPSFQDPSRPIQPGFGSRLPNPVPKLEEPIQMSRDTSMGNTPDITGEINQRLNIDTSDDDEVDSMVTDESSVDEDAIPPNSQGLPIAELPTGLCYDERMRYHSEVSATTGENVHPEDPRRIYYIYKELREAGLVATEDKSALVVKQPLLRIDAREATKDECCLVHTQAHYEFVRGTSQLTDEELIDLSEDIRMDSIYFNSLSYFSAKLSAGAAIETCRAVVSRQVKNAIAVIRPPGHHAEVESTMGFCLFNNVCVASRVCQADFGEECRKILILDWDVHHGNGCQKAFYNDPNILYISIHVHMNGNFYPSGQDGAMDRCGEGLGLGKNVNIPWPTKGMGDGDYMYAFQHVVMPIATEFDPDLVIVAAGFDAAAGDELGGCFVTPPCYAHMTHMLMSLADGKVAVCLEGGYNFSAISKSALAVTRTLMGEPPDRLIATQATYYAVDTVQKVRHIQSKFWRCINPKDPGAGIVGGERLHDIIRQYQAMNLYEKYKLTQLHIFRDSVSKSFDQQVLATPNYETKKHILVIFHDPPDVLSAGGNTSTLLKPHETWMVDGAQSYITWAVDHGFGVIDVNMPEHITITDPTNADFHGSEIEYGSRQTDMARKEGEKLAQYLWENYIEPYEYEGGVFLMGAGHAFHAVAKLVSENETVYKSLLGVVGFIAKNPVRPVGNASNHWIAQWYRENSLVYVSRAHSLWEKEGKVSKRYGRLIQSQSNVLNDMMKMYEREVEEWIAEKADLGLEPEEDEDVDGEEHEEEDEEGEQKTTEDGHGGEQDGDDDEDDEDDDRRTAGSVELGNRPESTAGGSGEGSVSGRGGVEGGGGGLTSSSVPSSAGGGDNRGIGLGLGGGEAEGETEGEGEDVVMSTER